MKKMYAVTYLESSEGHYIDKSINGYVLSSSEDLIEVMSEFKKKREELGAEVRVLQAAQLSEPVVVLD